MEKSNFLKGLGGALCLFAVAPLTMAQQPLQYHNDLSVLGTYIEPDDERTDDYGSAFRVSYGIRLGEKVWVEPTFFAGIIETSDPVRTDYYQQGLGADLAYRFYRDNQFTPFVLAGIGVSRNDVADNPADEIGGFGNVGLGFMTSEISDSGLRFRAEARYLYDSYDDGLSDIHVSAGVSVPLGTTRKEVVESVKYIDKPVIVEKEVVAQPADTDRDGVVDGVDQCPNTLIGLTVDAVGCVRTTEAQSLVLLGVTFDTNSDRLTANARDILDGTAQGLKGQPGMRVELSGYTDSRGSDEYNRVLSQKRATAVRTYLIRAGVSPVQLRAVGYGESDPLYSNDTAEGRERNRRVEFNVISQ